MELKTQKLTDTYAIKLMVEESGKVIGRAFLYILKNELHPEPFGFLEDVFVEEQYRSRGIGTQLIERAIQEAKDQGCYKLVSNSRFENEKAHKFYERFGFRKHGHEFRMDLK